MRLLSSVRIGQVPLMAKPASDDCVEEGIPAGARCAVIAIALSLLERVVDGYRKGRMGLFGETVHCLGHAIKEERLGLLPCCRGDRVWQPVLQLSVRRAWQRDQGKTGFKDRRSQT
jgi:hypothetical protein